VAWPSTGSSPLDKAVLLRGKDVLICAYMGELENHPWQIYAQFSERSAFWHRVRPIAYWAWLSLNCRAISKNEGQAHVYLDKPPDARWQCQREFGSLGRISIKPISADFWEFCRVIYLPHQRRIKEEGYADHAAAVTRIFRKSLQSPRNSVPLEFSRALRTFPTEARESQECPWHWGCSSGARIENNLEPLNC
jgi:hypothetical protein